MLLQLLSPQDAFLGLTLGVLFGTHGGAMKAVTCALGNPDKLVQWQFVDG
jgi:hypothetical protein